MGGDYSQWREHPSGCCTLSSHQGERIKTLKFSSNFEIL